MKKTLILIFTVIFCTGCNDRVYIKNDFELIVTVDKEIVNMIDFRWYKPDEEHHFSTITTGGRSEVCSLKKDEVITVDIIFKPKESIIYDCVALVNFHTRKDFENKIIFRSNVVKVSVTN